MKRTLLGNRKLAAWVIASGCVLLASVALVGVALNGAVNGRQRADRQVCVGFNRFDAVITQTLRRSAANLPKLAYFRAHPDELAKQEREIRRQLVLFQPRPC